MGNISREQILHLLQEHWTEIARLDVRRISLFGSAARNEASPGSDIDILVEFEGPATFDHYLDLEYLLETILNSKVDLVTERSVRGEFRASIEKDLIYVGAAPSLPERYPPSLREGETILR